MKLFELTLQQKDLVDEAYMIGLVVAKDIKDNVIELADSDVIKIIVYFKTKYPEMSKMLLYPIKVLALEPAGSIGIATGYRAALRCIYKNRELFDAWLGTLGEGELDESTTVSIAQEGTRS